MASTSELRCSAMLALQSLKPHYREEDRTVKKLSTCSSNCEGVSTQPLPALEWEAENDRGTDAHEEELSNIELFVFSHEEVSDSEERQLLSLTDLLPVMKRTVISNRHKLNRELQAKASK